MNSQQIDLTGKRFSRLTVISYSAKRKRWLCKCDCGNDHYALSGNLRKGTVQSCGCLKKEMAAFGVYQMTNTVKTQEPLPVMSSRQVSQDTLFNKKTTTKRVNTMTFSRTKIGFDLPGQPKDKDADFYLWRKRMDEVESISKIEYSKAKFISIPQGVLCLFEATEPPAGTKVNIIECPYLAILLHSVEYKTKNWDTGAQDTVKPTAGELAYIEFLMNNKLVDSEDLISDGFFRYIGDPESLKENQKFCFGITYHDGEGDLSGFDAINAIAKQIKESAGASNGNGNKTYAPKQTAKEKLAEVKPLLIIELATLQHDTDLLLTLKELKISNFEYLSLLFK